MLLMARLLMARLLMARLLMAFARHRSQLASGCPASSTSNSTRTHQAARPSTHGPRRLTTPLRHGRTRQSDLTTTRSLTPTQM